jgi:hypothetical protein
MEPNMAWNTLAIVLALVLPVGVQEDDAKKKDEDAAKAKIAEFKKELKTARTEADVAKALERLGELQHPKVVAELRGYLSKPVETAIAAAEQLGKYKKDKDAAEALMGAAGSRKDKEGIVKCLRYAGDTGFRGITPKLIGFIKHRDIDIAKEAIDSLAKLRPAAAIDPLLNLWRELDGIRDDQKDSGGIGGGLGGGIGGGLGGVGGVGNTLQEEQGRRKSELTGAVESALSKISGEPSFKNSKEALEWWRKAKATFKEPE